MKYADVVATYDYYTLEQAREVIKQEQRNKLKKKRMQLIENIKTTLVLFCGFVVFPCLMFIYWLAFGY